MATLRVLVTGTGQDAPPMIEATRVYPVARRKGCDRIRIEQANGVRVAEFPIERVAAFFAHFRLTAQPDRVARPGHDYEPYRPVFPGWAAEGV